MNLIGFGETNNKIDILKYPFSKSNIKRIYVSVSEDIFHKGKFDSYGSVEFKNGNTGGEQKFKGETFDDVVLQIKSFLDSLK